jgi:hypothetical protein
VGIVVLVLGAAFGLWGIWTGVNAIRGREESRFSKRVTQALGAGYVLSGCLLLAVAVGALL